ncbi:hypothetical protein [Flavicella marina]|uniref:hypothetical protein n=1 Tax=Flavicella marina TaxID=1475951 RepID=UPI0012652442|nr:hypothetical protein [Flavicella marina]
MKKIILLAVLVFSIQGVFAQDKYQMKKINYYVSAAAEEFDLDEAEEKNLLDERVAYFNDYVAIMKKGKAGEISAEDIKTQINEVNKEFNNKLIKITGKTYPELKPFMDRMRTELKNI